MQLKQKALLMSLGLFIACEMIVAACVYVILN